MGGRRDCRRRMCRRGAKGVLVWVDEGGFGLNVVSGLWLRFGLGFGLGTYSAPGLWEVVHSGG